MQSKLLSVLIVVSATILVSGAIQNNSIAFPYSQQERGDSYHDEMMMKPGSYAFGTIASLQNDKNGNPTWIVSGLYKGSVSMHNETEHGASSSLPNATLDAKFSMVMTNGSAMHEHRIYDFTLTKVSMPNNSTTVYNGTTTITMRQGPVTDVPMSIKAMDNNAISVWIDPTKIQNHFGNTPIFGTIEKLIDVAK
jgi:hypothetical protein